MGSQVSQSNGVGNNVDVYQDKPDDPQEEIPVECLVLFPFKPDPADSFLHQDKASGKKRIGKDGNKNAQEPGHRTNIDLAQISKKAIFLYTEGFIYAISSQKASKFCF